LIFICLEKNNLNFKNHFVLLTCKAFSSRSTTELKEKVISKIQGMEDQEIIAEVYQLLQASTDDREPYQLSNEQLVVVNEAREQVKTGKFLTEEQANREIDEWLGK
jgi:hypothetical protein